MFDIKEWRFDPAQLGIALVFLFPLFTNTLRHWASSSYVLLALVALFSVRRYALDLKREEKIFLAIIVLHVASTLISNLLAGWTRASHSWFFSGDVRLLFAVPVYLYLRSIPGIWKYFLMAVPIGAITIGLTGIIDFGLRYLRGYEGIILAEGVYGHIFQGNISALWSILSFVGVSYYKHNKNMRLLCYSGAILAAIGALVSVTRNAWLSMLLLYLLFFLLHGGAFRILSRLSMKKAAIIVVIFIPVLYFLSGIEFVNARFQQIFQEPIAYFQADRSQTLEFTSIGFRLEQWRGALYAFEEKPVFGHGVGNTGAVHNRYVREGKLNNLIYQESADRGNATHTHSVYFSYLGDTGIVGFVLIILLLFYPAIVALKKRSDSSMAWQYQILISAAFILASFTEHPFVRNNWTSVFVVSTVVVFIWLNSDNAGPETG